MTQLPLITTYERRKVFVKTEKNVLQMRECYSNLHSMGFVTNDLLKKVLTTEYVRGI